MRPNFDSISGSCVSREGDLSMSVISVNQLVSCLSEGGTGLMSPGCSDISPC